MTIIMLNAYFYAIKWAHKLSCYKDLTDDFLIKIILESAKRNFLRPVCPKIFAMSNMVAKISTKFCSEN